MSALRTKATLSLNQRKASFRPEEDIPDHQLIVTINNSCNSLPHQL